MLHTINTLAQALSTFVSLIGVVYCLWATWLVIRRPDHWLSKATMLGAKINLDTLMGAHGLQYFAGMLVSLAIGVVLTAWWGGLTSPLFASYLGLMAASAVLYTVAGFKAQKMDLGLSL